MTNPTPTPSTDSAVLALLADLRMKRGAIDRAILALAEFAGVDGSAPRPLVEAEVPQRARNVREAIKQVMTADPTRKFKPQELVAVLKPSYPSADDRTLYNNVYSALRRNMKTDFKRHGEEWQLRESAA